MTTHLSRPANHRRRSKSAGDSIHGTGGYLPRYSAERPAPSRSQSTSRYIQSAKPLISIATSVPSRLYRPLMIINICHVKHTAKRRGFHDKKGAC